MINELMDINLFLEDFDNPNFQGHDWEQFMGDAVDQYNMEFGTNHNRKKAVNNYRRFRIEQDLPSEWK